MRRRKLYPGRRVWYKEEMAESGENEALLALQKYREYVDSRRVAVVTLWKNPPPPVMLAYGAVVLTSGVLFSALGQWSKLKGFVWGSGMMAVLDLSLAGGVVTVPTSSEAKISVTLDRVVATLGLPEGARDELITLTLELVQWELIYAVNGDLSENMRIHLSEVLQMEGSDDDRSAWIHQFLIDVGVDAFKAKKYLDASVSLTLRGLVSVFESRGYKVAEVVGGLAERDS